MPQMSQNDFKGKLKVIPQPLNQGKVIFFFSLVFFSSSLSSKNVNILNCIRKNPWAPMAHDTHGIVTVVDTLMSATIANGDPLQTIRVLLQQCGSVPLPNPPSQCS